MACQTSQKPEEPETAWVNQNLITLQSLNRSVLVTLTVHWVQPDTYLWFILLFQQSVLWLLAENNQPWHHSPETNKKNPHLTLLIIICYYSSLNEKFLLLPLLRKGIFILVQSHHVEQYNTTSSARSDLIKKKKLSVWGEAEESDKCAAQQI